MSRNLRLTFLVLGVILVICSMAALAYSVWPVEVLQVQVTLAPTVFSPP